jgi:hypothetical protein
VTGSQKLDVKVSAGFEAIGIGIGGMKRIMIMNGIMKKETIPASD